MMNNDQSSSTLFLVATPIGNLNEFSPRGVEILKTVDIIACEDTRNSLKLLSHFDIHTRMIAYHNFNERESTKGIIELLRQGKNVALISDAGYPLISDPGYVLVNEVAKEGFNISCISGPNAGLNALVASGLDTTHYLFYGFLNAKQSKAKKELEELKSFPYTMIFYEAPHRIEKTLKLAYAVFGERRACLARELTKVHEQFYRDSLANLCQLTDLKGEIVLLIEGNRQEEEIAIDQALEMVEQLVDEGIKSKLACKQVAIKAHISSNELYAEFLKR